MILGAVIQQPDEILDYDFDLVKFFDGESDTVDTVVCAVTPAGLTATPVKSSDTSVKVWVSGGTINTDYLLEVTITTTDGRVKQDELEFTIEEDEG